MSWAVLTNKTLWSTYALWHQLQFLSSAFFAGDFADAQVPVTA